MTTGSLRRRWGSIAAPLAALRLLGQATEFGGWLLLARRLGTDGFGQVSIVFLVCRYAGIIADWGASFRGSRDVASRGHFGAVHAFVRLRTRLSFAISAAAALVLVLIGQPQLAPLALVSFGLGMTRDWVALGEERGARSGVPSVVQGLVILGGCVLATTTSTAAAVVGVGYLAAALVSIRLNPVPPDGVGTTTRIHGWALLAVLTGQITSSIDTVLVGALDTVANAGIYAAVYRIPNALLAILTLLLGSLIPILARSHREKPGASSEMLRSSLRASSIGAAAVLVSTPIAIALVTFLFGDTYASGRGPLAILMTATAVITLAAPLHAFALAVGHDKAYGLIMLAGAVLNTVVNLIVIPAFGMTGAACSTLAAQIFVAIALWRLVRSERFAVVEPAA